MQSVMLRNTNGTRYYYPVIKSFCCKETENLFRRAGSRKIPSDVQRRALMKLVMLDAAEDLGDLRVPPSNRLEALKGDRSGQYSIRINDQWRICFVWKEGHAYEVEIVDYH